MNSFDERQKAYEDKFAFDEEKLFKAKARAVRALAEWVCEKTGLKYEEYASELVDLVTTGKENKLAEKISLDAKDKGVSISTDVVAEKFNQCLAEAKSSLT